MTVPQQSAAPLSRIQTRGGGGLEAPSVPQLTRFARGISVLILWRESSHCPRLHRAAILAFGVLAEAVERSCNSFGTKLAEIEAHVLQLSPAPVMDAAKNIHSQLTTKPKGLAQTGSPPKSTLKLNTVEQTPPRAPPRPQLEATRQVEAARAPSKVAISVGETNVRQTLKRTAPLTVVRKDI